MPATDGFDHVKRDVMIPMRDGVKLHTVILVPKGAQGRADPADAHAVRRRRSSRATPRARTSGPVLSGYDNATDVIVEGGYIRVVQDVRGKYGSEGDYVMNRPLRGPQNPTPVDHATDTYDTIDWLVKNVPETQRQGRHPRHLLRRLPAADGARRSRTRRSRSSVPMNPMVDGWMGDDWFHNGAFRQQNMPYIYDQEATRKNEAKWWTSHYDDYDMFMQAGSAGELGRRRGLEQVGLLAEARSSIPAYDAFWRDQAVDKLLAAQPLKVPVMLVHSLWDQEDIYGAIAVYKAIEPKDTDNDKVFLVMGPWYHGQEIAGRQLARRAEVRQRHRAHFRREILRPFLDQYLKDGAPKADVAPVTAFETGHERLAAPARLAGRLRERLRDPADAALPRARA